MPVIVVAFCLLPFLVGLVIEYIVCRCARRHPLWRALPPVVALLVGLGIGFGRYQVWSSATVSPWTQLVIFPGLPVLFALLGTLAGWRLWRRLWGVRVVRDKGGK